MMPMFSPHRHPVRLLRTGALVLLSAILLFSMVPDAPAWAPKSDFYDEDAATEATLSEMTTQPVAEAFDLDNNGSNETIVIAYQGVGYVPYLSTYNRETGVWNAQNNGQPIQVAKPTENQFLDGHGSPVIYQDSNKYFHIIFGSHHSTMSHVKSKTPNSLTKWTDMPSPTAGTYPQVLKVPNVPGKTLLFYRNYRMAWSVRESFDGGATWQAETEIISTSSPLTGSTNPSYGYGNFTIDKTGTVHAAFVYYDHYNATFLQIYGRSDVYYFKRDFSVASAPWQNSRSETVATPISMRVWENGNYKTEPASMSVNAVGSPKILDVAPMYECAEITVQIDPVTGQPAILFVTDASSGMTGTWGSDTPSGRIFSAPEADQQRSGEQTVPAEPSLEETQAPGQTVEDTRTQDAVQHDGATSNLGIAPEERDLDNPRPNRTSSPHRTDPAGQEYSWGGSSSNIPGEGEFTWIMARPTPEVDGAPTWSFTPIMRTDHVMDSGAFMFDPDGSIRAALTSGGSYVPPGTNGFSPLGRGGTLWTLTSTDAGTTWSAPKQVSPAENGSLFASPIFVRGIESTSSQYLNFIDWTSDVTNMFNRTFLARIPQGGGAITLVGRTVNGKITRNEGVNRVETAIALSKAAFPSGARAVVIATEADYPDALVAGPLAAKLNAPILLTNPTQPTKDVINEIIRLRANKVILMGGTGAISDSAKRTFASITIPPLSPTLPSTKCQVERFGGIDRFETASIVAASPYMQQRTRFLTGAVIVNGDAWADAASAGPLASMIDAPILLSKTSSIPQPTFTALKKLSPQYSYVVGGTGVVDDSVLRVLPAPERFAGLGRYETSKAVADQILKVGGLPLHAVIATGDNYPDALAASSLAVRWRSPVLLSQTTTLSKPTGTYLKAHRKQMTKIAISGGEGAISTKVEGQITVIMNP